MNETETVKHTPGPWEIGESNLPTELHAAAINAVGPIPTRIAEVLSADLFPANARLIAAAPELLEACEALMLSTQHFIDWTADAPGDNAGVDAARAAFDAGEAAIAKATEQGT